MIRSALLLSCIALLPATATTAVQDRLVPLPAGAVQLTGLLDERIRHSIAHWNRGVVPYAGLVQRFRKGRDFFAQGEMWGKAVRSGCQFYRYHPDPELKRLLAATVADLLTTRRANGSISCSEVAKQPDSKMGDLWERKYVLLGLDGYYDLVEQDPAVLQAMIDEVDATIAQIGPAPKIPITNQGWSKNGIESSSILEPVMRLYRRTGEQRFLEFARSIVEAGGAKGANIFIEALEGKDPGKIGLPYPKAYEMTSVFEGLVEFHRVTGDERWRTSAVNLFQGIRTKEITLIGNGGGDQPHQPGYWGEAWDYTASEQTHPAISRMMETCVGVTWMKYCHQILRLTGDPVAVDEIERYVYNGLLGAMKPEGDGFSYVNLLNGVKTNPQGWGGKIDGIYCTCCNLNGPMGLAYIPLTAAMQAPQGPVVNLYAPGTITAATPSGKSVTLSITTAYPREGTVAIAVATQVEERFAIALRIPAWSATTALAVNGEAQTAQAGTYAVLERMWKAGDRIEVAFDMRCRVVDAPKGSSRAGDSYQAVLRGPLVLARDENRDAAFDQPVSITAAGGFTEGVLLPQPTPPAIVAVRVPVAGGTIDLVDYASVDSWSGKNICTWLPMSGHAYPRWIWHPEYARGAKAAPVGKRWFRRIVDCPAERKPKRAVLRLSADDACVVFVNGRPAGEGQKWQEPVTVDCTADLHVGRNVIAVVAENRPFKGPNNAAGLIAVLHMEYEDGSRSTVVTDRAWQVTDKEDDGWQAVDHPTDGWKVPSLLGLNGVQPWAYLDLGVE